MESVECIPGRCEPGVEGGPETVIPQRERVLFLARLATLFVPVTGLFTVFTAIDGFPVLNVMPLAISGRAVTVGCGYREGQWWFCYARTGALIRPVNELGAAAHQIRVDVERAAR